MIVSHKVLRKRAPMPPSPVSSKGNILQNEYNIITRMFQCTQFNNFILISVVLLVFICCMAVHVCLYFILYKFTEYKVNVFTSTVKKQEFHHHKDLPFGPFIIKSPSFLFPSCISKLITTDPLSISTIFPVQECYVNKIIQHVNFVAFFHSTKISVDSSK